MRHWVRFVSISLLFLCGIAAASSPPIASIPVGDGPVGIQIGDDSMTTVVPLLFPQTEEDANLVVADITTGQVTQEYRIGRRLFDAVIIPQSALARAKGASFFALAAFGDQDFTSLINLDTGQVVGEFPVGSRPGGISAFVPEGSGDPLGLSANGSSGDVSVFNLSTGATLATIPVGRDPRDAVLHPGGRFIYAVLGGESTVVVADLNRATQAQAKGMDLNDAIVARLAVGSDPVDFAMNKQGTVGVVANSTNNTVTVLDLTNPGQPTVRRTSDGSTQLPVGVQPQIVAVDPGGNRAFVANSGSAFLSVVDLATVSLEGVLQVQREGAAVASSLAAVDVSPDGQLLAVTERGNGALLNVYDLNNLELDPPPTIEVPGEPAADILLATDPGFACPGFYIASVELEEGAGSGFSATEILTTAGNRLLQGGLNIGGAFAGDGRTPGFAAFNIANRSNEPQRVELNLNGSPLDGGSTPINVSLELIGSGGAVVPGVSGTPPLALTAEVNPGFYRVRVRSASGSPAGVFDLSMATRFVNRAGGGFQGGVNVGGFASRLPDGTPTRAFASFCIDQTQIVRIRTEGSTSVGPSGAGPVLLTVRDRNRTVVQRVSNTIPPPPDADFPEPPELEGATPRLYVDDDAAPGGNGTQARPYRSITDAVGRGARAGDVILVAPGVYSPSLTGERLPIGSPGAGLNRIPDGVQLIGSGSENTIIDAEDFTNGGNVNAVVLGGDNVRMAGFTVRNASAVGIFSINARGVRIDRNFVTGNARFGIGALSTDGILITENVAVANAETGIAVSDANEVNPSSLTYPVPSECSGGYGSCILRNVANDHRADGILVSQGGDYIIRFNQCFNNGVSGIEVNNGAPPGQSAFPPLDGVINDNVTVGNGGVQFAFSGTGILITELASASQVLRNDISNNRPGGIAVFEDAEAGRIANNEVRDNAQNAIVVQKRSRADVIENNSVESNGLSGIFVEDNSSVGTIRNNEINRNGTCLECSAAKAGLAVLGNSSVTRVVDNNFSTNAVGFEINNQSSVSELTAAQIDSSVLTGGLVRQNSSVARMMGGRIANGAGSGTSLRISGSSAVIDGVLVTGNAGTGITYSDGATGEILTCQITDNGVDGIAAQGSGELTIRDSVIRGNGANGVLATTGSQVSLIGSTVEANGNRGVNAAGNSSIQCTNSTVGPNGTGATFGNVTGC